MPKSKRQTQVKKVSRSAAGKKSASPAPKRSLHKGVTKKPRIQKAVKASKPMKAVALPTLSQRAVPKPFRHLGFRLASLVLMFWAVLVSNATLALAASDSQAADQQVQAALQIVEPKAYLYKVADADHLNYGLLTAIAQCESHWKMVKSSVSSAYGFFQILDGTAMHTSAYQNGESKYDPQGNIDMAVYLYQRYGTAPWSESKPCWQWYQKTSK